MRLHKNFTTLVFLLLIFALSGFVHLDKLKPYKYPDLQFFPKMPHTSNSPTEEGAALGRFLFYDSILSYNLKFSCASCHKQEYAFSDAPNMFSKGMAGVELKRNTMPLFNLAWYPTLFWDGKATSIEGQVFHPVQAHDEMNLDWTSAVQRIEMSDFYLPKFRKVFGTEKLDSTHIAKAIGQFERTLISHNSKYDSVLRGEAYFTKEEYLGFELINDQTKGDCLHCHTTDADALGTTTGFSNNGLDAATSVGDFQDKGRAQVTSKKTDIGKFKIPSLRNVVLTPPYMHDGRFATLEAVLDFYSEDVQNSLNIDPKMEFVHSGGAHLTKEEKDKIIAFLHTLTDSVFITNPEFGNPFFTLKRINKEVK